MILPKDRDPRFITIRRGGTLTDSDHRLLALWAAACAEHILHLFESVQPSDPHYPNRRFDPRERPTVPISTAAVLRQSVCRRFRRRGRRGGSGIGQ
jgi:hypothetical protein